MARVRTSFGTDEFHSGIDGVPVITSTDVEVDDDKIEELAKAAENADVTLVLNAPLPEVNAPTAQDPQTVINPTATDQPILPSSTAGLVDGTPSASSTPPSDPSILEA